MSDVKEATGYYHHRRSVIGTKICHLLQRLLSDSYESVSPSVGFWIEHALTEQSMDVDDLVEQVSFMAWTRYGFSRSVARFLREFRDAPHRSEKSKSFVDKFTSRVVLWFAAASAESLTMRAIDQNRTYAVTVGAGEDFIRAASFVGYIVEWDLVSREFVRQNLVKPLISHYYYEEYESERIQRCIRTMAIHRLFVAAKNTLLQGYLEPRDVQVCFDYLDARISLKGMMGPDPAEINGLREFHAAWLKREEAEKAAKPVVEVEAPAPFDVDTPSPPATPVFSPTFSTSTVPDLTPTELGKEIKHSGERKPTRHDTFYFKDGNMEIMCGDTIFRVHSTVISFSPSKLRGLLSPATLLKAPMPEGRPRITVSDSAEDFAVLLKMIYTPGFPARNKLPEFRVFASLLRMVKKYGFSAMHEQLFEGLKVAYPTKWEDFRAARLLGENIFASPKPHPNAVLNLFLELNVKFALPFAAYRASLGGLPSLASDKPGTVLPRPTLNSIIDGMEVVRRAMALAAHSICMKDLGVCAERACVLKVNTDLTEVLEIFDVMLRKTEEDMLSSPSLGTSICVGCARRLEKTHLGCRKEFVWPGLPGLLGWESWEGV